MIVTDLAARGIDIPFMVSAISSKTWFTSTSLRRRRCSSTALAELRGCRYFRADQSGNVFVFIAPNEIVYMVDLIVYIGRELVSKGNQDDFAKAFYGKCEMEELTVLQE